MSTLIASRFISALSKRDVPRVNCDGKNPGGDESSGTWVSPDLSQSKGHEVAVFCAITASNLLFALSWRAENTSLRRLMELKFGLGTRFSTLTRLHDKTNWYALVAEALLAKSTRLTGDLLSLLKGPRRTFPGSLYKGLLRQRYRVFGLVACAFWVGSSNTDRAWGTQRWRI